MLLSDSVKELAKRILSKEILYYIFPALLIIILYFMFLPFNQNYIGEWHDIFANSMYYSIIDQNYFITWNNLWSGGFPLYASPHSDKYYIFSFPFYLIFQNLTVVNYILLLHLLIAYFAFFKLGSLITKNKNALLIFSLFFAFSGIMLGRVYGGHHLLLYGLAWVPLLYYYFFKMAFFNEANIRNAICLAIVSALIYFTGNLYHFILAYLIILVFVLYLAIRQENSRKIFCYFVLAVLLTTLLISVKNIPDLSVSGSVLRQDIIDPLAGGGSVETDLSSFIFGMRIDSLWAQYESAVMIGVIPLLLMIVAFIYGRKDIVIPAFFAILFSCIWAAGGKTIFSFIHLLPILSDFRNPGRIFGALLPLVLLLALYGAIIIAEKLRNGERFALSPDQQKMIAIGAALLIAVKLCELPFQEMIDYQTIISVILVAGFMGLLYFQKGSIQNVLGYFVIALVINAIVLSQTYAIKGNTILVPLSLIGLLLIGAFLFMQKNPRGLGRSQVFCGILLAGIFLMMMGNLGSGYVNVNAPQLDKSAAPEIIKEIKNLPSENAHLWVYETGWPIKHMEYTYFDVVNNIHPMTLYSAYFLKTMPQLTYDIGNVTYFASDYIIDTQYLENGNQNIPESTFKVQNISVYKPEHVLPLAFYIRNNELYPLKIEKYAPGDVVASGQLFTGDIVILKGAYYPGWKVNGASAENTANMIGTQLSAPTEKIEFTFDPLDYKIGVLISVIGVLLLIVLFIKRREVDAAIADLTENKSQSGLNSKKKRKNNGNR